MKISLNWIKDFVDIEGIPVRDLWYRFTMSAAEVEEVIEKGNDIKDVVVGKVIDVKPHPNSRKLKICSVDIGSEIVQSLCGAPNVAEGMHMPFARVGGAIKKVPKVGKVTIAGVESSGILCSAAELGISDNHEGVMVLPGCHAPGTDIKSIIDIDDIIIEIDNKSLTNRPDLWGHYGIAREVAAIFKRRLKPFELAQNLTDASLPDIDIRVEDAQKCFRYSGICIEGIKVKASPVNMQTRLYYCGMRPISALVDLTNYLMLETGQPMHAFDRRYIDAIVVKSTEEPINFTTLDGVERNIPEGVLMICNREKPVAIAGIMGGENSEVLEDTEAIILESANFEGSSTRKNSTRLGLRTEASARFEKMLDPNLTVISVKRFIKLLKDMQPDIKTASNLTDIYVKPLKPVRITVTKPYIDKYVGNTTNSEEIVDILESLEFKVKQDGDTFTIDVPSFRATKDVTMKADIIEEISRIYGYDNIEPKTINVALKPLDYNEERLTEHRVRDILSEKFAFSEVNSYIWYDTTFNNSIGIPARGNVKILNPHARDMNILRDSMVPIMLGFVETDKKFFDGFSIFEIGGVFNASDSKSKCSEHKNLCALMASRSEGEDSLFYKLKGITTALLKSIKNMDARYEVVTEKHELPWVHPVKAVEVLLNGKCIGYLSVLHPKIMQNIDRKLNIAFIEINMTAVHTLPYKEVRYAEPSKYPEVTLDYNFLVDKAVVFDSVDRDIKEFESDILMGSRFIDIYEGKGLPEGKKSMTFRFTIGSGDKTLSSEEIDEFSKSLLSYMESRGYVLRAGT